MFQASLFKGEEIVKSVDEMERYDEGNLRLKEQIEEQTGKTVAQLYAERSKRVRDVIELREPDRVPFLVLIDTQAYYGLTNSASYYAPVSLKRTMRKVAIDVEPDVSEAGFPSCGAVMTLLDVKNCIWPGGVGGAPFDTIKFPKGHEGFHAGYVPPAG